MPLYLYPIREGKTVANTGGLHGTQREIPLYVYKRPLSRYGLQVVDGAKQVVEFDPCYSLTTIMGEFTITEAKGSKKILVADGRRLWFVPIYDELFPYLSFVLDHKTNSIKWEISEGFKKDSVVNVRVIYGGY